MSSNQELKVTCRNCGRPFRAAIQMDRGTFDSTAVSGNTEQCPHCGQSHTYDKADYSFG